MTKRKLRATIGLLALLVTANGMAQPEATPKLVPPTVTTPASVQYPETAIAERHFADTEVVLIVDVDKTGAVTRATPETPAGHGFDEAAVAAAMELRFEPATRDGTPIAARIKYRFLFHPPPAQLAGRVSTPEGEALVAAIQLTFEDGTTRTVSTDENGRWLVPNLSPGKVSVVVRADGFTDETTELSLENGAETNLVARLQPIPSAKPDVPTAAEEEVVEVEVRGEKPPREVTKRTLSREEIDKIPGTSGDALRSLQSMPGVARPPPFGGFLIVRGSAPAETTTFVDGTPIPQTYHFGGLSSVVPTEALDRIDFYPGNYGVAYGRGTAGMVDVALRAPKKEFHGFAQLDLIDLRLLVEGPIGETGWTFLAAGRRSWFDLWLVPVLEEASAGVSTAPRYYDYQIMLQKDFGKRASLRTTFFGSDDALAVAQSKVDSGSASLGGSFENKTRFYRFQAIYTHQFSPTGEFRAVAAAGRDQVDVGLGGNFISTTEYPLSLRSEVSERLSERVRAHVGVDLIYSPYDLSLRLPPNIQQGGPPAASAQPIASSTSGDRTFAGAYTELELVPWRGGRIVPGLRADYASTTGEWDVSPRINVRHDLTEGIPRTTLKGGVGLFYQPPSALETDPNYGQTGLESSQALQYTVGFEQQFTEHLDLSVEAYGKNLDRLVVSGQGNSGEGRAYGAETMLRFKGDPRFFGWIAYTLERSERRDDANEAWHLFQYDQTHNLTVVGSYELGSGFRLGGRFRLTSGSLYTPSTSAGFDASSGSYTAASQEPPYSSRLPFFHQLDVRLDKTWTFSAWKLTAYADIQNIYNHRAKEGVNYNFNYTASSYMEGLTILPSLGLRVEL